VSAMETCKDERRENLVPYAPRRPKRMQDDGSIRPILERLSRGDDRGGDAKYDASVVVSLPVAHIDAEPQRTAHWPLLVCSVLSAGVSAVVVVLAIGWFGSGGADDKQASAIDPNPKSVQTVSFKEANNQTVSLKQNKISEPPRAAGDEMPIAKDQSIESGKNYAAAAQRLESALSFDAGIEHSDTNTDVEQMPRPWVAKPLSLSSQGWQETPTAKQDSSESASTEIATPKPSKTAGGGETSEAVAPSRREPSQRQNETPRHHSRRGHSRSRTHHARRHAPRQTQGTERAPSSTEAAAQPETTNVWQSTWQSVFGHPEPPPSRGMGH
jgi:hypothetical protein